MLGSIQRVQGTLVTVQPFGGIATGGVDLEAILLTDDGLVAERLPLERLSRGGVAIVAEWVNLARPPLGDVWLILDQIPSVERAGFLARVEAEELENDAGV